MLISCTVTVQLICTFVFAYAKIRFSHDEALLALSQGKPVFGFSDHVRHKWICCHTD